MSRLPGGNGNSLFHSTSTFRSPEGHVSLVWKSPSIATVLKKTTHARKALFAQTLHTLCPATLELNVDRGLHSSVRGPFLLNSPEI
jgi:hypothetical protein